MNQYFWTGVHANIGNQLQNVLSAPPYVKVMGSDAGLEASTKVKALAYVVPFKGIKYSAQEFVFARMQLRDPLIQYIDFVAPVLNVEGHSIQGVGTFMTHVPFSTADSYIKDEAGFRDMLMPASLKEQGVKPKQAIKQNLITSAAVNAINEDRKLCKNLHANHYRSVEMGGLSHTSYEVSFKWLDYPGRMFYTIPYRGSTVMIARNAGEKKARINYPDWGFFDRFSAFRGVAHYLSQHKEPERHPGMFHMDTPLALMLPDLLHQLDAEAEHS